MKRVNTIMEVKRKRTLTDDNRNGSSKPGGDNVTIKVEKEKGEKSSMIQMINFIYIYVKIKLKKKEEKDDIYVQENYVRFQQSKN